jgi:hypothetical protein
MTDGISLPEWPDPGFDSPARTYDNFDFPTPVALVPDLPERDGLWVIIWHDDGSASVVQGPWPGLVQ